MAAGQETRREIVNAAPTPADDGKPNSDKVPDVVTVGIMKDGVDFTHLDDKTYR